MKKLITFFRWRDRSLSLSKRRANQNTQPVETGRAPSLQWINP